MSDAIQIEAAGAATPYIWIEPAVMLTTTRREQCTVNRTAARCECCHLVNVNVLCYPLQAMREMYVLELMALPSAAVLS
jgi:hypothetical protein